MEAKIVWLFVFVALYWAYCIFWGVRSAMAAKTASDYFLAGRKLSIWVFVLAATATSFSGWTFMGHPGLIYRDGFQYAYASFYAITIPFTGVMFLKRQWMLGKRFGYVTPGEMLADYFQGGDFCAFDFAGPTPEGDAWRAEIFLRRSPCPWGTRTKCATRFLMRS